MCGWNNVWSGGSVHGSLDGWEDDIRLKNVMFR